MATRVGKYKISKRESALNLTDGGTISGDLVVQGSTTLNGNVAIGDAISDTVGFFGKTAVARTALIVSGTGGADVGTGLTAGPINDSTGGNTNTIVSGSAFRELVIALSKTGIISSSLG